MLPHQTGRLLTDATHALREARDTRYALRRGLRPGHPERQKRLSRAIERLEQVGGRLRSEVGRMSHTPGPHAHEDEVRAASRDVQAERHSLRRMVRRA